MQSEQIKLLIEQGLPGSEVVVEGDGTHFNAIVVYEDFEGRTRIQKQQLVYATVNQLLLNGSLHALSLQTFTPAEWAQKKLEAEVKDSWKN